MCSKSEVPLQPAEKTTAIPLLLQPMGYHAGADIHAIGHGKPYARAGRYALKEAAAHGEEPKVE